MTTETTALDATVNEILADVRKSIVAKSYKDKYALRAKEKGSKKACMARGCGDWLHSTLATYTLENEGKGKNPKLLVAEFEAILTANGVRHEHWNRVTPGWQGRLRMTGRMALNRVVAEAGFLVLANGETKKAPASWVAAHLR